MRAAAVVKTVGRIVETRWPTTEAERVGLFAEVGFVDLADGDRQFTALGGEGRWSTHDDQFLGFSLFLFEGEARPRYDELRRLLIERFGAPLEEWGPAELLGDRLDRAGSGDVDVLPCRPSQLRPAGPGARRAIGRQ